VRWGITVKLLSGAWPQGHWVGECWGDGRDVVSISTAVCLTLACAGVVVLCWFGETYSTIIPCRARTIRLYILAMPLVTNQPELPSRNNMASCQGFPQLSSGAYHLIPPVPWVGASVSSPMIYLRYNLSYRFGIRFGWCYKRVLYIVEDLLAKSSASRTPPGLLLVCKRAPANHSLPPRSYR
jgi:hypothetical protein